MSLDQPGAGLDEAAARLVADLMPVAIVVAATRAEAGAKAGAEVGAAGWLEALERAGAGAERFAPGLAAGFDLAILLAGPPPADAGTLVEGLAAVSDRLLFVPEAGTGADLDAWFELFAEQGYQPVVEYDASFLAQGAFLVDRNATAAETELSAFAERLSMGGALAASTQRVAVLEAELGTGGDRDGLKAALAARQAELTAAQAGEVAWRGRAQTAESALAAMHEETDAWRRMAAVLGDWIRTATAAPGRTSIAALRGASGHARRKGVLGRLLGDRPSSDAERQCLADAALIRPHRLFDAGWYIASHPELAESGADPLWHYVLHGADAGADPGPFFDTAAYRAAYPEASGNPLAHAIRAGRVEPDRDAPG